MIKCPKENNKTEALISSLACRLVDIKAMIKERDGKKKA